MIIPVRFGLARTGLAWVRGRQGNSSSTQTGCGHPNVRSTVVGLSKSSGAGSYLFSGLGLFDSIWLFNSLGGRLDRYGGNLTGRSC